MTSHNDGDLFSEVKKMDVQQAIDELRNERYIDCISEEGHEAVKMGAEALEKMQVIEEWAIKASSQLSFNPAKLYDRGARDCLDHLFGLLGLLG